MNLPFREVLKQARLNSLWPRPSDFAKQVGISSSGLDKMETGVRLPLPETLSDIIKYGQFSEAAAEELRAKWRAAKSEQVGLPVAKGPIDIPKVLNQLENEIIVVLRQYAPLANPVARQIAGVLKKRAEVILRTALET